MYRTVELRIARSVGGGHPAASAISRQVDHPRGVLRLHVISITTAVRECSGPNSTEGRSPYKRYLLKSTIINGRARSGRVVVSTATPHGHLHRYHLAEAL